ncbi:hypothetical protein FIBSPDRAFT_1036854 [Athelia psychrophila]|uniref:SAGA-associated factor 11 n=1 Tax=Athelia psychrophila TaxID=1759441 RepID=A0A166UZX0_9AGAM|nr:hypothetical protein FIBSPDRAFT_1036854 [Fibularhizoctonia sp. CBS 109695]
MVKSEREKALNELTSRILESMVGELVMDATLASHQEVARSRAVCHICHTRCGLDHLAGPSTLSAPLASSSRHPTPDVKAINGSNGTGASTPTSVKADGTVYFECLVCKRQIASNRYAPHLSSCLGHTGTRRATNRSGVKAKTEAARSESPFVGSDNGMQSDDTNPSPAKGKTKTKGKRADDADFNLKRKRMDLPQTSPTNKKQKKQKTSGSPVSRVRANTDGASASNTFAIPSTGSQSKVPSKLRDSSIASFGLTQSTPSSRSSSPGTPMASHLSNSTSTSTFSMKSPPRPLPTIVPKKKGRPPKNGNVKVVAPPPPPPPSKRASPPRPPLPPVIRAPDTDFHIDIDGHETGSDTDSDSS